MNSFGFENNTCDFSASFKETMEFLNIPPEHLHPKDCLDGSLISNTALIAGFANPSHFDSNEI